MNYTEINTLGKLRASGYTSKSLKEELRDNLIQLLKEGNHPFPEMIGYEKTVIPQLEQAILAKHNINLLGLRGQGKTKIARSLVGLLDEYTPVLSGCAIPEDPLHPITQEGLQKIEGLGDEAPIYWMHRSERFFEKLATPDVSVADLIGDVDPIKAANMKKSLADESVIHYGMVPRAHRCIFVINELPDLQARIQVALFNILEEGDLQIRGFKMRLPIDVQFLFTANPEDYTNRGSIVTPLKDRIGTQILTHYPQSLEVAKKITAQEIARSSNRSVAIHIPEYAKDIIEQVAFEARKSEYVDHKSGVSARMTLTAYEHMMSAAERRALLTNQNTTCIRMEDLLAITPAITGKIELVYEGEQEGADEIAGILLGKATVAIFEKYFPRIEKLKRRDNGKSIYDDLVQWFQENDAIELTENLDDKAYQAVINGILPLSRFVEEFLPQHADEDKIFLATLVLWGMVEGKLLSADLSDNGISIDDPMRQLWK